MAIASIKSLLDLGYLEQDSTVGNSLIYPAEGYQVYIEGGEVEYIAHGDDNIVCVFEDNCDDVLAECPIDAELDSVHVFAITKTKVL